MKDMLLEKCDADDIRDNLIFNYILNDEEPVFIKSFIHHNQIDLGFSLKEFYFFMTGTHRKLRLGSTPVSVKNNLIGFRQFRQDVEHFLSDHGFCGKAFMIKVDNSKQASILFSPTEKADCTPEEAADMMRQMYFSQFSENKHIAYASTSLAGPYCGYEQIHQAFLDARELNDLRFFGIRDRVITKEYREETARPSDISAIYANMRRLITAICFGTCAQALRQINAIIYMVASSYSMDNFNAMSLHFQDMLSMLETVYADQISIERKPNHEFYSLDDYCTYLKETVPKIFEQLDGQPRYSPTILMALSYIRRNYARDISLIQLSEYVYANPSTLSSEFNNEVGVSLSEYIANLRIEKAEELLRTTALTVPEIAKQVGFSSDTYFRKIFKKQTGMSAQAYRRGCEREK